MAYMEPGIRRYYDFKEINSRLSCIEIAKRFTTVADNRCKAVWRNGDNTTSVSLSESGFHDFGTGESGSAVDLYALFIGKSKHWAQQELGDELMLEPKMLVGKERIPGSRAEKLHKDGYKMVKEYVYRDEKGNTAHVVERWEHPTKKKEFLQRDSDGKYSIKGLKTVLYRLPEIMKSPYVVLVEGEKDVHTVVEKLGFEATTNASGAGRWEEYYTDWLKGKDIIIIADNDEPGELRANHLLWTLKDVCGEIKVVKFKGEAEGFDITDYVEKYGVEAAKKKIVDAPSIEKTCVQRPGEDYNAIQLAKEKNKFDFTNFFAMQGEDEKGHPKTTFKPRHINDLIKECHDRFIRFPRRIGDRVFDHDRESGKIEFINSPSALFSWMGRKSKKHITWKSGEGYVTKEELLAGLLGASHQYESIAFSPSFPSRDDTYYAHPPLPAASEDRQNLEKFISHFNPATMEDRILIKAMTISPLYYRPGIPKPAWIVDSEDGAGTGKTTLVEMIAYLYNTDPIRTTPSEISSKFSEITKRIVSSSGRMCKVFLLDNVTGDFRCPTLADMITARCISGKAPYGKGEESRPNDLTYIITANSAMVDNDLAQRSWLIHLKRSEFSPMWRGDLIKFINAHRYHIIAEIVDMIQRNSEPLSNTPSTRFPEFETEVLQACCGDMDTYSSVFKKINDSKALSNVEEEEAQNITEILRQGMLNIPDIYPDHDNILIRSAVIDKWFKDAGIKSTVQHIRNLAKNGLIKCVNPKIFKWPTNTGRRGIFWDNGYSPSIDENGKHVKNNVKIIGVSNGNVAQIFM